MEGMPKKFHTQPETPEQREQTLPAAEMPNETVWVNPKMHAPFNVRVGEPSPLGLFFSPERTTDTSDVSVRGGHNRSGVFGKVVFRDENNVFYRDIDLKGIGNLQSIPSPNPGEGDIMVPAPLETKHLGVRGLYNKEDAIHDAEMAEQFAEWGIRTDRVIAITELKAVQSDTRMQTVSELKESGVIDQNEIDSNSSFQPVVAVRAYGVKSRIGDYSDTWEDAPSDPNRQEKREFILEDAMTFVSAELNKPNFSKEDYLQWFSETLGQNIGLLHKHGYVHGYLHNGQFPNNITLDCRLTDRDSVVTTQETDQSEARHLEDLDRSAAESVLSRLINEYLPEFQDRSEEFSFVFNSSYRKTLASAS